MARSKFVLIGILVLGAAFGLWFTSLDKQRIAKLAARALACPVDQIEVRSRGARSGYYDVTGCGSRAVYYSFFGISISRQQE